VHTHANTVVKLIDNAQDLVARCIILDRERRIVSADLSNVTVLSVAKLRVVVAWYRIRYGRGTACRGASMTASCNLCNVLMRCCLDTLGD
jgi:hypothetical protein